MVFNIFKKKNEKAGKKEEESGSEKPEESVLPVSGEPGLKADVAAVDPSLSETQEAKEKGGFFDKLKRGLSRTRDILTTDVDELFAGNRKIGEELLEELEELLITSDIGVQIAMDLMEKIRKKVARIKNADDLKQELKEELLHLFNGGTPDQPRQAPSAKPLIIMVIGVNGVGKTTTIGKLAARFRKEGKSVLIAAADTFRAAAVEQLGIWAERTGSDFVKHRENGDPGAVAYDSIEAAISRGIDVVLIDTAGRLHTRVNLMEELKKIRRVISSRISTAPHEVLLVLDATTGQNALSQAKLFHEAIGITGIALTKLDGTAKGGIVITISNTMNIPIKYIGIGESIDDLEPFDPDLFVKALF